MANRRSIPLVPPLVLLAALAALAWWWLDSTGEAEPPSQEDAIEVAASERGGRASARKARAGALGLLDDVGGAIAGRVTSSDGTPIAGADVCARTDDDELGGAQIRVPHCVRTEHDGSYRLEGLWRVRWGVSAAARGFLTAAYAADDPDFRGIRLDREAEIREIDIVLEPGGVEIQGVVKDLGGGEIEGAFVSAASGRMRFSRLRGWGAITRTDAEGAFSLWVEEGDVDVSAQAEGYTDGGDGGRAPGMFFTIVLTPESVLAGTVRDTEGNPVAGVKVDANGEDFFGDGASAISGEDGRYRIDRLGPGRYKPEARTDGAEGMAKESVRLGIGESLDPVDIVVHPAALVRATVKVEGGGTCVEGSLLLTDSEAQTRSGGTVKDGTVEVQAVRPGHYQVDVRCDGYASAEEYPALDVGEESVTDLVYEVHPGKSVRGVLVDAEGNGIGDGSVYARQDGPNGMSRAQDRPDASGRFELEGLVPGTYKVNAWAEDHPQPVEPITVVVPETGEAEELRIQLDAPGEIRGTVKDAEGNAMKGVTVAARGPLWQGASVLDDGTFVIEGLRPGDYRVSAQGAWWGDKLRKPGASDDDVDGEPVTVVAGEVAEVQLVVETRKGKIEGTVVDEAGGPLADAYISVTRESDSAIVAEGRAKQQSRWGWGRDAIVSDVDGRFVADDLAEGTYTIRAYRKGGGEGFVEGAAVGESVQIRIEVEGSVSGIVTLAEGGAPERFHVTLRDAKTGFDRGEPFAHTDGAWALHEMPAGTYEVIVSASEGTAELEGVVLEAGEEREGIALTLEGRTTIRGRVVALDTGEPIEGLTVSAWRPGGSRTFSFGEKHGKQVTAADGTYELSNAPSGKITLMTFPTNFMDWDSVGRGTLVLDAKPGGVVEAPDIVVVPKRVPRGGQAGDLGFALKQAEIGKEAEINPKVVGLVRPDGPAAASGLKVGDVIVSVDGHDVTSANTGIYAGLASVPEGTTIELGLERGTTVRITAGPPI